MNSQAKPSARSIKPALLAAFAAAAFSLAGCTDAPEPLSEAPLAGADIGGDFTLTNQAGERVSWADFRGTHTIVYFGFTYCPDICPTDMQRMAQGLRIATERDPEIEYKVKPVFITVDPERDTPEVVGEFVSAFDDDIVGLTGTAEEIAAAASAFRVYYSRGEDTPGGGYLVDHSAIVYLFGPDGEPIATLPTDRGAEAVADEIERWVR